MKIKLKEETNLLNILQKKGVRIEAPCNGNGTCGKCKVKINKGVANNISKIEKDILSNKDLENGIRLACRTELKCDLEIEILSKTKVEDKKWKRYSKDLIGIIDLGTTSIKVEFYDYETKKFVDSGTFYNPQRKYGYDVLNRISYALKRPKNINELQELLIDRLNEIPLIKKTKKLILAGNSTMESLFLGVSPESLTIPPYSAPFHDGKLVEANELGLDMISEGEIEVYPNLSAFVGGDTYSILNYYMHEKPFEKDILIIDIGTNGELLYIGKKECVATSTAAGPAFEGASIECGMTANPGALIDIDIDDKIKYKTIGNKNLKGISGSGIFSLISELLEIEIIDENGRLKEETKLYPELNKRLKNGRFYINDEVYISQNDIREIQKSKSAIRTAVDIIVEDIKKKGENLKKIIITGNFGENLKKEDIFKIGILNKKFNIELEILSNSVILGLREDMKKELNKKTRYKCNFIDLNKEEKFNQKYIKNLNF